MYSEKPFCITATQLTQSLIFDETDLKVTRKDYESDNFDIIVESIRTKQIEYIFRYRTNSSMTDFLTNIVKILTEDWDY